MFLMMALLTGYLLRSPAYAVTPPVKLAQTCNLLLDNGHYSAKHDREALAVFKTAYLESVEFYFEQLQMGSEKLSPPSSGPDLATYLDAVAQQQNRSVLQVQSMDCNLSCLRLVIQKLKTLKLKLNSNVWTQSESFDAGQVVRLAQNRIALHEQILGLDGAPKKSITVNIKKWLSSHSYRNYVHEQMLIGREASNLISFLSESGYRFRSKYKASHSLVVDWFVTLSLNIAYQTGAALLHFTPDLVLPHYRYRYIQQIGMNAPGTTNATVVQTANFKIKSWLEYLWARPARISLVAFAAIRLLLVGPTSIQSAYYFFSPDPSIQEIKSSQDMYNHVIKGWKNSFFLENNCHMTDADLTNPDEGGAMFQTAQEAKQKFYEDSLKSASQ